MTDSDINVLPASAGTAQKSVSTNCGVWPECLRLQCILKFSMPRIISAHSGHLTAETIPSDGCLIILWRAKDAFRVKPAWHVLQKY